MTFERFIARRYLFSGKKKASFSAIAVISILGVALGVYALIVVIAVMDGFDANLQEKFVGANAHINVLRRYVNAPPLETTETLERIRAVPGVHGASPYVQRLAMATVEDELYGARQAAMLLQGVDLEHERKVTKLMDSVVTGTATPEFGQIVLGRQIAEESLFVPIGQRLLLLGGKFAPTPDGIRQPAMRNVSLSGVFRTGFPQADEMTAYAPLNFVRNMFVLPANEIDGIRVSVSDIRQIDAVARNVEQIVGPHYQVVTWLEQNAWLFDALRIEKWAMFIILLLVVLVAAFNIIGILTMIVLEKTREIGILKSMGATEGTILRVFLNQGLAIGGIGVFLGGGGGLLTLWILDRYIRLPKITGAYLSDKIPILITPGMVLLILGSAFLIVLIASLLPARQAARLDPVEALRYE